MQTHARDAYLQTEVMTATPQKLQLMLIDAAIRFSRQALVHWQNDQHEEAGEAIIRAQEVVAEILGGLRVDRDPPLVRRVAGIYTFVSRQLAAAHTTKDVGAIEGVIRVLEIERATWQQVCEQLGSRIDAAHHQAASGAVFTA
jgi:flagellar protein FliS